MKEPKHTHSIGGVILNERGEVLVVNNKGRSWTFPKGHLEEGEDEMQTLYREIKEETGLAKNDLILHKKLGTYERWKISKDGNDDQSERKEITLYFLSSTKNELAPEDPENPEARWVDQRDVEILLTHPDDKQFYESIRSKLKDTAEINTDLELKLVFLKSFPTIFEAESAKQLLEAEGIKAIFHTLQPNSAAYLGNITGGELFVKSEDLKRAQEILGE